MGHDLPQRNRLWISRWDLEIQVIIYVAIEVELPLFDKLHHRSPGEELGNRSGTEQRAIGGDWLLLGKIGVAVALGEEHFAVFDHRNHGAGNIVALDRERH